MRPLGFDPARRTGLIVPGQPRDDFGEQRVVPTLWHKTNIGPWDAEVRVEEVADRRGRYFRVVATWTGPPLAGAAPSDVPVQAADVAIVGASYNAAWRVACQAAYLLGRPERPDLQALASSPR